MSFVKRFILKSIQPFGGWLFLMLFIAFLWAIDISLRPVLLKMIVNQLAKVGEITDLIWCASCYLSVGLFMGLAFRVYDWSWMRVGPPLKKYVGERIMDHMMCHSVGFFEKQFSGNIGNKIKEVMDYIPELVKLVLDEGIAHILAIFIAILTFFSLGNLFPVILIGWVFVFVMGSLFLSDRAYRLSKDVSEARSVVMGRVMDILNNMINIRLFLGKYHESCLLSSDLKKYVAFDQSRHRYLIWVYLFQAISFMLYETICIIILIYGFHKGKVTPGDFVLVLHINASIIEILWQLSRDYERFYNLYGAVMQGLKKILSDEMVPQSSRAIVLENIQGNIVFDHVSFTYPDGTKVFQDLSLQVFSGEKVGIVGYSGAGKTTFLSLIVRFFDIQKGSIFLDGTNIQDISQDSLHRAISVVPQDIQLFNRTLIQNIQYGREGASFEDVQKAVRQAEAEEFVTHLGYDAMVGERGARLSGGQRQRIAIARAFLKNAPILLIDEGTSHLDSITERMIQNSLSVLMKEKTVLVIAHRLSTLLNMDRILVFDKGKIIEEGTHGTLLNKGGFYKTLWNAQMGGLLPQNSEDESLGIDHLV